MNATLLVVSGNTTKRKVALKLPSVLGRSREADVTVAHPLVSRKHCELAESAGILTLRDLASLNGTMIGGRKVSSAPLLPGAEFAIGPLTFRVLYEYHGDLESLPEVCYIDDSWETPGLAPGIQGEDEIVRDGQDASLAASNISDSRIVAAPDLNEWADADPDEVIRPIEAATLRREHQAVDSPDQDSTEQDSPWSTDEHALQAKAAQPPQQPTKKPNYGDEIDPEFGNFLEDLQ